MDNGQTDIIPILRRGMQYFSIGTEQEMRIMWELSLDPMEKMFIPSKETAEMLVATGNIHWAAV